MRLKQIRENKRLSLRDLAKISGVDFTTINRIETGATGRPAYLTIVKLAKALGIKADSIFDDAKGSEERR
jgi:transcriptional regulator with XRE-family HTH domain